MVKNRRIIHEAVKLFEADTKRQAYHAGASLIRGQSFECAKGTDQIPRGAKKRLLIYDPKISDPAMLELLEERSKAGVEVRVIGCVESDRANFPARKMVRMRLHTRTILRDSEHIFLGSQSLRAPELDQRREVGLIFRDRKIAATVQQQFEGDWEVAEPIEIKPEVSAPVSRVAKRLAKKVAKRLPAVAPLLEQVVGEGSAGGP